MAKGLVTDTNLTNIANAIRNKNGSSDTYTPSQMANAIANIPTASLQTSKSVTITENGTTNITPDVGYDGIEEVEVITNVSGGGSSEPVEKDVNFYDYDGTRLYSYTAQEFLNLTAMPELVDSEGMIAEDWNYNLANAKAYVQDCGELDIGQLCKTSDDISKVYIEIEKNEDKDIIFAISPNGTFTIDWGDNTATSSVTGTSVETDRSANHTYSNVGKYIIKIIANNDTDTFGISGYTDNSTAYNYLIRVNNNTTGQNPTNKSMGNNYITKIELSKHAKRVRLDGLINLESVNLPLENNYRDVPSLTSCNKLKHINISKNTSLTSGYTRFRYCYSLKRIVLSDSITTMTNTNVTDVMSSDAQLEKFFFPRNTRLTSVGWFVNGCNNIKKIIIPSTITTLNISSSAVLAPFGTNPTLKELDIKNMTIPGNYVVTSCGSLTYIKIGKNNTTIKGGWFGYGCLSLRYIDLSDYETIPTLSGALNTSSIGDYYKIIVPDNLYEDWKADTTWSTYASKIINKSEYDAL